MIELEALYARAYAMTAGHFKLIGASHFGRDEEVIAISLTWESIFRGHQYGCRIEGSPQATSEELSRAMHALLSNAVESLEGVVAAMSN